MSDPLIERVHLAQVAWANAGLQRRLEVLQDAGQALAAAREALYQGLYEDHLSVDLAHYYGEWIVYSGSPALLEKYAEDHGKWAPAPNGGELMVRRPDGVVLLIVPANSPTINAAPLFSILLAGNGVVLRSPNNDRGLRLIAEEIIGKALERAGFSADLVTVVCSRSRVFLDRFMDDALVRTVIFFGNSTAGQSVAERGHRLGKKVVLELEGSDHMLVWKDADLAGAVRSAKHAFDFSTQPCPIPKHFLVHDAVFDTFLADLIACVPASSVTVEADPVHGNLVPVGRPEGYFAALEQLKGLGTIHCGGYRMDADGTPSDSGHYLCPTVVSLHINDVLNNELLCFDEEIFFPLIPVVRFDGSDDQIAAQMANVVQESQFGLRCSVWCQDIERLSEFTRRINDVGLLIFNGDHSQCPVYAAPWGGPRRSGGPHGENHLFWLKTSHLQAISCTALQSEEIGAVLDGLGFKGFAERAGFWAEPAADLVTLQIVDQIATLTLNRPATKNAINRQVISQLSRHLSTLEAREAEIRCVVIRGAGATFCSGADLRLLRDLTPAQARDFMVQATWTFRRFERLSCPVIAAVDGYCMGGGVELALHCDEVVATESCIFGLPETGIGFVTTAGSVGRLVDAVGGTRARELLLSGRRVTGIQAEAMGLASQVVPADALAERVDARCQRYRQMPRSGVAAMKRLLRSHNDHSASWIRETESFEQLVRTKQEDA